MRAFEAGRLRIEVDVDRADIPEIVSLYRDTGTHWELLAALRREEVESLDALLWQAQQYLEGDDT